MRFLVFLFFLCFTSTASSEVNIISINGVSKFEQEPGTDIWGVFIGEVQNSLSPYNSCATQNSPVFEGCHPQRVNGDTAVTITFKESSEFENKRAIALLLPDNSPDDNDERQLLKRGNLNVPGPDSSASISFTWKELCTSAGATFNDTTEKCSTNLNLAVQVGIESSSNSSQTLSSGGIFNFFLYSTGTLGLIPSTACDNPGNNYGFCDLSLFPGDEGAFINFDNNSQLIKVLKEPREINAVNLAGNAANISAGIIALKIYLSSSSFNDAQPSVSSTKVSTHNVQSFNDNIPEFDNNEIGSGLKNGKQYFYRAASVDESGTISQLFDNSYNNVNYTVTPSEVAGLITESSCFITTATYGSPQAYQVKIFRKFRKNILWKSLIGHKLILLYNTYGPYGAQWLHQHPRFKILSRLGLYPLYLFASLSLSFGFLPTLCLLLLTAHLSLTLIKLRRRS